MNDVLKFLSNLGYLSENEDGEGRVLHGASTSCDVLVGSGLAL